MIAKVIVDISTADVDKIFEYIIPDGMDISVGDRVNVPFGNKIIEGFCIGKTQQAQTSRQLKDIIERLDEFTALSEEMLELMVFMKNKYHLRSVDALRLFVPAMLRGKRVKEQKRYMISLCEGIDFEQAKQDIPARATAQRSILDVLSQRSMDRAELNNLYSSQALKVLLDKGIVKAEEYTRFRKPFSSVTGKNKCVELTKEQQNAFDTIQSTDKTVTLLFGVTGSGKTEVYMRCIEKALAEGKTAIMLVPEISLTPQTLKTFRARFGDTVAMLHSGLSHGERFDEWRRLLNGDARIVVGARSAIFSPLKNVGIIIVDEEHDGSYSSDSNPRYKTIDIAIFRAKYNKAKLVLGSATPSIESYYLAEKGEYQLARMSERIGAFGMPKIDIMSMSNELLQGNTGIFSRELVAAMGESLAKGEQIMLFLNRRGFQSFIMCKKCGHVVKCPHCDVSLTYHKEEGLLKCHCCGKNYKTVDICPECGNELLRYGRIGTEKVVEEVKRLFKDVKTLRLDNDTVKKKSDYMEILSAFAERKAQVLVGTQMIAKGHDFSNVTLVGILDADIGLYYGDYRCGEKTFQLVTQMAGRAGRAEKGGRVILQTFSPNHFVFRLAKENNYINFYEKEINTRQVTKFPPYSVIVKILFSSYQDEKAIEGTKKVTVELRKLQHENERNFILLQPSKDTLYKSEDKYRYRIIIKLECDGAEEIINRIYSVVDENRLKDVTAFVDINPSIL